MKESEMTREKTVAKQGKKPNQKQKAYLAYGYLLSKIATNWI